MSSIVILLVVIEYGILALSGSFSSLLYQDINCSIYQVPCTGFFGLMGLFCVYTLTGLAYIVLQMFSRSEIGNWFEHYIISLHIVFMFFYLMFYLFCLFYWEYFWTLGLIGQWFLVHMCITILYPFILETLRIKPESFTDDMPLLMV
jgi:hypothetical protein